MPRRIHPCIHHCLRCSITIGDIFSRSKISHIYNICKRIGIVRAHMLKSRHQFAASDCRIGMQLRHAGERRKPLFAPFLIDKIYYCLHKVISIFQTRNALHLRVTAAKTGFLLLSLVRDRRLLYCNPLPKIMSQSICIIVSVLSPAGADITVYPPDIQSGSIVFAV